MTSCMWLINNLPLSSIVSEIWRIFGPIFAVDRGCLALKDSFEVNPKTEVCEIWIQETRNTLLSYRLKCMLISWTVSASITTDGRTDRDKHYTKCANI